jgi:iron complex transport system ATP-binding protein
MKLSATNLTVRYPGLAQPAVDMVDLDLSEGELVVMAGPNGSGKSSCFSAMIGAHPAATGTVELDGRRIESWSRPEFALTVAALPQFESRLFSLRVREAVALGRWARLGPFAAMSPTDTAAVDAAIRQTRLVDLANRSTDTLSGGEWQRVRLARALASEPRLLLLDEPGAALDLAHEMALFEFLRELVDGGMGVLAITHHLNLATRYADRIVLLDKGRIAGEGSPTEVLVPELVSRVFDWPVSVHTLEDGSPHLVPQRR